MAISKKTSATIKKQVAEALALEKQHPHPIEDLAGFLGLLLRQKRLVTSDCLGIILIILKVCQRHDIETEEMRAMEDGGLI